MAGGKNASLRFKIAQLESVHISFAFWDELWIPDPYIILKHDIIVQAVAPKYIITMYTKLFALQIPFPESNS